MMNGVDKNHRATCVCLQFCTHVVVIIARGKLVIVWPSTPSNNKLLQNHVYPQNCCVQIEGYITSHETAYYAYTHKLLQYYLRVYK